MPDTAQRHAQRGRRLPFTCAGVHDQQPFLLLRRLNTPIDRRLEPFHLCLMFLLLCHEDSPRLAVNRSVIRRADATNDVAT